MRYAHHFLSDVILRVDFVSSEDSLKQAISSEVKNVCVKHFAIPEDRQIETRQVIVTNNPGAQETIINKEQFYEWHFFDTKKEKELCITNSCMFTKVGRYYSFDDLKQPFFEILETLMQAYPTIKFNRVGLRYVNQINFQTEKRTQKDWYKYWGKYISDPLIRGLSFPDEAKNISRNMNSIEMNYGEYMLRFQYGIFNPDYPAPIKKNTFVLDTDVYATGLIEAEDVKPYANRFHEQVINWFEKAIKAALREKMGAEE